MISGRNFQKIFFYLSSFIPLYFLLFIQNVKVRDNDGSILNINDFLTQFYQGEITVRIFWIGLCSLSLMSLFGVYLFFKVYAKKDGRKGKITEAEFVREDTLGYIVTYIVPLITMDVTSGRSLTINVILFIIIGTFYVKNDQIFMNPLYNIFGYNVFSAEEKIYITKISKSKLRIIAKNQLLIKKVNLIGDIYVLTECEQESTNNEDLYN